MQHPTRYLLPLALTLQTLLTGCAVYTPAGSVVIDPPPARSSGGSGNGNGTFCPPGQAKKGHC